MCAPSAPPPPDYAALARQQGQESRDTAIYNNAINRVNQVGPNGSTTWSIREGADRDNPRPGDYIQTTTLSPEQQALQDRQLGISRSFLDTAQAGLGRVADAMGSRFDTSGLPQIDQAALDRLPALDYGTSDSRRRVEEALMSRVSPELDRQQQALDTRLLNAGIERGSEAWEREQRNFGQQRNDASFQAVAAGGAEESRLANLQRALRGQLFGEASAARGQGIQEQAFLRSLPLNEINALRTGSQVTMPQFGSYYTGGTAQAAPIMDAGIAKGNYDMGVFQNRQAGYNALMGGLAGLGGAALGSDPIMTALLG